MGTYGIPRNVKGEGRILFIFSTKALIYTAIGATIGFVIFYILKFINLGFIGIILAIIFAILGFCIGTFKVPNNNSFELTKKTGGENIDEIIKRAIKFKIQKNKLYVYTKEEKKND